MESHRITYEGIDFEVFGNYENSDPETNYKGGWATELIKVNDVDIYWMLLPKVIERITEIVTIENY